MKKIFVLLLSVTLLLMPVYDIYGENDTLELNYTIEADTLKALGLFKGMSETDYGLNEMATRAQGAVMLVRFMGMEASAETAFLNDEISHPFNDVPFWADPHVAFLYTIGLVNGISETQYDSNSEITANQYITMLLRMLGYDDDNGDQSGDFYWNGSGGFMADCFEVEEEDQSMIDQTGTKGIERGVMVRLSYLFLSYSYKHMDVVVYDRLHEKNVILDVAYETHYKDIMGASPVSEKMDYDFEEIKGIWFSYMDLKPILSGKSEVEYRNSISEYFQNIKEDGFNTAYYQVRPFSDALYESEVYPWSSIITGKEGEEPGYDPFRIAVEAARENELRIEAWINPYRIGTTDANSRIDGTSTWELMQAEPDSYFQIGDLLVFNPANDSANEMIVRGVEEIIEAYDIDGIQLDDYFYPSGADMSLDAADYEKYISEGNDLSHEEFRRLQTTKLIQDIYSSIKDIDVEVEFGISPHGNMNNGYNYDVAFIDVHQWIEDEIVDYLLPQVYFGFENTNAPFGEVVSDWNDMVDGYDVELILGLSAYKIGAYDTYAGEGKEEWIDNTDLLARMVAEGRGFSQYDGFSAFRYQSLYDPSSAFEFQVEEELSNLRILLKDQ